MSGLKVRPERVARKPNTDIVDCDVHNAFDSIEVLIPYLTERWRDTVASGALYQIGFPYSYPMDSRRDAGPAIGKAAGSDLDLLKKQLLNEYDISNAILTGPNFGPNAIEVQHELGSALASAYNDWLIANWLDKEDRLRGSALINANDPDGAVREISRIAAHPRIVQIGIIPLSRGCGEPFYHPIYQAAQNHDLVIGIHIGPNTTTAIGQPPYFIEWRTCLSQHVQTQLVSLIAHGVFEKYPRLRVTLIEGGWTWLPSLLWRFDMNYKALHSEVPWLRRRPSEYIHDHIRLTTQPTEEITTQEFLHLLDVLGSDEVLMFSSDYPHWDFDSPLRALPSLPESIARKVYAENARAWYEL